jgi:DNA invertase Pin-like site-specific DNA recombinase
VIALAVSLRRSIIAERVRAGLARARAEGKRLGGAPSQRGCSASLLKPVADTIERFYHVKLLSFSLNFLRTRLMWLSMVRSST